MYPVRIRPDGRCAALAGVLLLAACGGGGSGGTSIVANLQSAAMASSLQNFIASSQSKTLSASDTSGNTYTAQITQVPGGGAPTFNGTPASSTTRTTVLTKNGVAVQTTTSVNYYTTSPFLPLGSVDTSNGSWSLVPSYSALPATVTVGQGGTLLTTTDYQDSTLTVVAGNETTTWSASVNNASTLLFCTTTTINAVPGNALGMISGSEKDCYTVDVTGTLSQVSVTITSGSVTLTFK